jgi:hypothetical protein
MRSYCKATETLRRASCPYCRSFRSSRSAQMTYPRLSMIQVTLVSLYLRTSHLTTLSATDLRNIYLVHSLPSSYISRADGAPYDRSDYYANPQEYRSSFHSKVVDCYVPFNHHLAHVHRLGRTLPDPASQRSRLERWISSTTHDVTAGYGKALSCCWRYFM